MRVRRGGGLSIYVLGGAMTRAREERIDAKLWERRECVMCGREDLVSTTGMVAFDILEYGESRGIDIVVL